MTINKILDNLDIQLYDFHYGEYTFYLNNVYIKDIEALNNAIIHERKKIVFLLLKQSIQFHLLNNYKIIIDTNSHSKFNKYLLT